MQTRGLGPPHSRLSGQWWVATGPNCLEMSKMAFRNSWNWGKNDQWLKSWRLLSPQGPQKLDLAAWDQRETADLFFITSATQVSPGTACWHHMAGASFQKSLSKATNFKLGKTKNGWSAVQPSLSLGPLGCCECRRGWLAFLEFLAAGQQAKPRPSEVCETTDFPNVPGSQWVFSMPDTAGWTSTGCHLND